MTPLQHIRQSLSLRLASKRVRAGACKDAAERAKRTAVLRCTFGAGSALSARRRNTLNTMRAAMPRGFLLGTALIAAPLLIIGTANRAGLVIGNISPSVPRGLYLKASPEHASHVTFCLGTRHRGLWTYQDLCSPDTPDAPQILKRIATRHPNGSLTVAGDTPRALDSRYLGPIRREEIRGWWVPWLTERPAHIRNRETRP